MPPPEALQLRELDHGSVIAGNDRPFTPAEAQAVYEQAVADTPGREASVIENVRTGERVVVQGEAARWAADPDVWEALMVEHGPGPWRGVRHSHPIGMDGVTSPANRFPSGIGGDLTSARGSSLRTKAPQSELIDIVVRRDGRLVPEQVHFGYEPGRARPFWIDYPGPNGERIPKDFASLLNYHEWFENETGLYSEPIEAAGAPRGSDDESGPVPWDDGATTPEGRTPDQPPESHELDDLPDGSIMSGGDGPLSHADADTMYENAWADSPGREVMVMENIDTGERIVLQGDASRVGGDATPSELWHELAVERGGPGHYRGVRHSHALGGDGLTPPGRRLPSGFGADMSAARKDALTQLKPQREVLDIVTEYGRQQVRYGYDQTQAAQPWYVDVPDPRGAYTTQRFANMVEYHRWLETMTGEPHPIQIGDTEGPEASR
jgi:hypothetical protein